MLRATIVENLGNSRKFFDHFSSRLKHLTKDILTTKVTKGSDVFDHKLRALRVLRGKIVLSSLVAASPGQAVHGEQNKRTRCTAAHYIMMNEEN